MTFLIGPQAQELFFKANDDQLSQDECYHFMTAVFGPDVVYDAPKRKRQVQFQTMANGLRTSRMKTYVGKIQYETIQYLKDHWNATTNVNANANGGDVGCGGTVNLYKALSELTILTASRCLHGDDVREHMFKELQMLYHDLDEGLTPLTVLWSTAPTPAHLKRNKARQQLVELFRTVIQQRREHPEKSDGTDILSLFMEIVYKDGTKITEEEVTGLLIALLFAGQHTSCTTSTWTMLWMLHTPHILQRVLDEQERILQQQPQQQPQTTTTSTDTTPPSSTSTLSLDLDAINQMEILHNCMREALRLCPTFIMLLRKALQDLKVVVDGKTMVIPKGDLVVVSPTVSMRLNSTFPKADTFDPDRYGPEREEHKIPYAYLGFGGGMHSCMGQVFAFCQVKTILSTILYYYDLEMEAKTLPDIGYTDMVVGPRGNCNVHYRLKRPLK